MSVHSNAKRERFFSNWVADKSVIAKKLQTTLIQDLLKNNVEKMETELWYLEDNGAKNYFLT